jgi:pimeloyl-ACP methyl ester carboxylesterase
MRTEQVHTRGLTFEVAIAGDASSEKLALLLHGFPECAYSWRHQMPLLAKLGYKVWAPNLRGYGKTDRPLAISDYAVDKLEQDVADLVEASGCKSTLLIGHDWGGAVAWNAAIYHPQLFEKLVVMNVPHPACFRKGLGTFKQLKKSWYMLFFGVPKLPELALSMRGYDEVGRVFRDMAVHKERFSDEVLDVFKRNAAEPGALTAMLNYYRAMPHAMRLAQERGMPKIEIPTLLLWGEQDAALGKELTYGTREHVSDLTLRYIPDASHWVQQDAPETVNAMLEAWLLGKAVPEAS